MGKVFGLVHVAFCAFCVASLWGVLPGVLYLTTFLFLATFCALVEIKS